MPSEATIFYKSLLTIVNQPTKLNT